MAVSLEWELISKLIRCIQQVWFPQTLPIIVLRCLLNSGQDEVLVKTSEEYDKLTRHHDVMQQSSLLILFVGLLVFRNNLYSVNVAKRSSDLFEGFYVWCGFT